MIGRADFVIPRPVEDEGKISILRVLYAAWPKALLEDAERDDEPIELARFNASALPDEFLVYRDAAALNAWDEEGGTDRNADSMIHVARAIGAARTGNAAQARAETETLALLRDALVQAKNGYWAEHVEVQRRMASAWTARAEGKNDEAVTLIRSAVELEESTEKHNITPGPILTARELAGDLFLELGQPGAAVAEYEASLRLAPNRFKSIHGAARAAAKAGDGSKARQYYQKVVALAASADTERPELVEAKAFLGGK